MAQVYIAAASFASLIAVRIAQSVRTQQIVLFGALIVVLSLKDVSATGAAGEKQR